MKKIEATRKRKVTIAVAVLLVVVPIGLLGVLMPMRVELEPIMIEPVSWRMERPRLDPDHSLPINESVHNANTTDEASVGVGVHLLYYKEDWDEIPFGKNGDGLTFRVDVTAAVAQGFESFFVVRFRTVDAYSTIYVERQFGNVSGQYLATYNATIVELREVSKEWVNGDWYNVGEAYVKAESTSLQCGLSGQIHWVFNDQNNEDHQLEVILEFTYFSQTTSQKITVPIVLNMDVST